MADPIGVFVRFPLSHEQSNALVDMMIAQTKAGAFNPRRLVAAIGVLVFDSSVPMACCADRKEFDLMRAGHYQTVIGMCEPDHDADDVVILATQESIQAAIALRDSRIAVLEEELSGYRAGLSELVAKEVALLKGQCSMSSKLYTLESAPVGLLQTTDGVLILKTEYSDENGAIDAYIVESGEFFWGDHPQTPESQRNQTVHAWTVAAALKEAAP